MNEIDETWAQLMNASVEKARVGARGDVAEYFELKAVNDAIRRASVKWLFDSTMEIAAFASRHAASFAVEDADPHQFSYKNANLVGSLLRFRQGVRCLTLEAGWTRTPSDGFMRGGALAAAQISHFGVSKYNEELLLVKTNDLPNWFSVDVSGKRSLFDSQNLNRHFQVFLGELPTR